VPELSAAQKFALLVTGEAFVGLVDEPCGKVRLYVAKCKKHGLFLDTPHGYKERLDCPECEREERLAVKPLEASI
jgi:hypothetical protein